MSNVIYEKEPYEKVPKSAFDLSKGQELSGKFSELIPINLQEVVPGDEFKIETEMLIRFAPMLAPTYADIKAHIHYFFVPLRQVFADFENFFTGGKDGQSSPSYPVVQLNAFDQDSELERLADYFGLPTSSDFAGISEEEVARTPFLAYNKIYNDWYRDQNLTDEIDLIESGTMVGQNLGIKNVLNQKTTLQVHLLIHKEERK